MRTSHLWSFAGVFILLSSTTALSQPEFQTTLNFIVRAGEYHGTMYVPPPTVPAVFLAFATEPLSLSLAIGNPTIADRSLNLSSTAATQAFKVTAIRIPAGGTVPSLLVNPVADVSSRGVVSTQDWAGTIDVPTNSSIVWKGTLFFAAKAAPGVYELQITPTFGASDGSALNPFGTLVRYEVRDVVSREDRAELARRRMMHAYVAGAELDAETAADALLAVYPQSALAYQVKGEMARRQGRAQQAVQSFERAVELLASGQDTLYVAHVSAQEVNRMLLSLRQTLQVLQRRQP
jgi:hypothetical protein